MIKLKATKKQMRENHYYIISAGYCSLQALLNHQQPFAYSAGNTGWQCDYYLIDDVLISTGYGPIASKNTSATYDMIHEYEKQAQAILYGNYDESWEVRRDKVNALLHEFVKQARK